MKTKNYKPPAASNGERIKSFFEVLIVENCPLNTDDSYELASYYESQEEAVAAFEDELKEEYEEHGMICRVELWSRAFDNEDKADDSLIRIGYKASALLPRSSIIVTYQHRTNMYYSYSIENVRRAFPGERYKDLNVSVDKVDSNWDVVLKNIHTLADAFENESGEPFYKICSGGFKIQEFLIDNGLEGYNHGKYNYNNN